MAEPPTTTASTGATAERDVLLATKLHLPRLPQAPQGSILSF
jgi:hypothetical protein